jgi:hypothetical protein
MLTFIALPNDFVSNIASSTNDIISGFSGYITLILGVLLAGVIVELIIGAVRHK